MARHENGSKNGRSGGTQGRNDRSAGTGERSGQQSGHGEGGGRERSGDNGGGSDRSGRGGGGRMGRGDEQGSRYEDMSLSDLYAEARRGGIDVTGMDREDIVERLSQEERSGSREPSSSF